MCHVAKSNMSGALQIEQWLHLCPAGAAALAGLRGVVRLGASAGEAQHSHAGVSTMLLQGALLVGLCDRGWYGWIVTRGPTVVVEAVLWCQGQVHNEWPLVCRYG